MSNVECFAGDSSMAHVSSDVYRRGEFSYVYVSPVQVVAATSIYLFWSPVKLFSGAKWDVSSQQGNG